jgi:hypothetical protein
LAKELCWTITTTGVDNIEAEPSCSLFWEINNSWWVNELLEIEKVQAKQRQIEAGEYGKLGTAKEGRRD